MFESRETTEPIYLTREEALALLDICMTNQHETPPAAEAALCKVAELVRWYMSQGSKPEFALMR